MIPQRAARKVPELLRQAAVRSCFIGASSLPLIWGASLGSWWSCWTLLSRCCCTKSVFGDFSPRQLSSPPQDLAQCWRVPSLQFLSVCLVKERMESREMVTRCSSLMPGNYEYVHIWIRQLTKWWSLTSYQEACLFKFIWKAEACVKTVNRKPENL